MKPYPRRGQMVAGYQYTAPIAFNEYGWLASGHFPADCIESCSASGSVDDAVEYWVNKLFLAETIAASRDLAVRYLQEFGAWDDLDTATDERLACRILWIACCDIREQGEWLGLVH